MRPGQQCCSARYNEHLQHAVCAHMEGTTCEAGSEQDCIDSTPSHSYMKYLHKYPQVAYPTTTWSRPTAAGAGRISSLSCSILACSTRTATLTCSSSTPRPLLRISCL